MVTPVRIRVKRTKKVSPPRTYLSARILFKVGVSEYPLFCLNDIEVDRLFRVLSKLETIPHTKKGWGVIWDILREEEKRSIKVNQ